MTPPRGAGASRKHASLERLDPLGAGPAPAANGAPDSSEPLRELLVAQHRILQLINSAAPLAQVIERIAENLDQSLAPLRTAIVVVDPESGRVRQVGAPGLPVPHVRALADIVVDGHQAGGVRGSGEKNAHEPRWAAAHSLATRHGVSVVWSHAIIGRDRNLLGGILLHGQESQMLGAARCRQADSFSVLARLAIENDRYANAVDSANKRFAALSANIPGVVYQRRVSPDGEIRYTYISQGARELFGVPAEEILADPQALFNCHGPSYSKNFRERLLAASRALSTWDVEAEIITRNGQRKWTHAIARPTRLPDGAVLWDGIILDATRIAVREQELRRAAEAANRAKSEFIANMSHELRTPLNAIIGFSELMHKEIAGPLGTPQYQDYCRDILESGRHLLGIINDVLDLAKIESGKMKLHEEIVELPLLLESCARLARESATKDGISISISVEAEAALPRLHADERLVLQIVTNLVSNAVKFTDMGGRVAMRAGCGQDRSIQIVVQDSGIGMRPEDIPRALERFGQLDSSLGKKHQGTGLGLPLVKALAELHGGALELESDVGAGTTATVRFPPARTVGSE